MRGNDACDVGETHKDIECYWHEEPWPAPKFSLNLSVMSMKNLLQDEMNLGFVDAT